MTRGFFGWEDLRKITLLLIRILRILIKHFVLGAINTFPPPKSRGNKTNIIINHIISINCVRLIPWGGWFCSVDPLTVRVCEPPSYLLYVDDMLVVFTLFDFHVTFILLNLSLPQQQVKNALRSHSKHTTL